MHPKRHCQLVPTCRYMKRAFASDLYFSPPIISKSNDKVRAMKKYLFKHSKARIKGNVYLEGHRLVIDALRHGILPESIFLTQREIDGPNGHIIMSLLMPHSSIVYRVDEKTMDSITTTVNPQGICGIFKLAQDKTSTKAKVVLICDRIRDPGNLGTMIRTSYVLGVDSVVVIEGCDAWSPKVLRSSMGYNMRFPVVETTWKKWNEGGGYERLFGKSCTPHVFFADAASPDPANSIAAPCSGIYHMADLTVRPLLLVVGSEAVGISPEARVWNPGAASIHIPMIGENSESLNAAAACAIILSEIQRQEKSKC